MAARAESSGSYSAAESLRCVGCGRAFSLDEEVYTCPVCGPLAGTLDILYNQAALRSSFGPDRLLEEREPTIWRYHDLLPIRDAGSVIPLPIGMTPLYRLPPGPDAPPVARLWVKDDTRHPSGSSKDRATAVGLARARELGRKEVAAASTGNAASSLAMLAARAGMRCSIFAPAAAPPAKLIQIRAHGAVLFAVEGSYDDAFDLCMEVCGRLGLYNRNTAINPFLGEGKKTIALEIWEQLGFRAPDAVVVPVGDGCILGGVFKGFRDLLDLGLLARLPRLIGVQAEGSAALADAWARGDSGCRPVEARTVADSISVSVPRDQVKALRAVRESGGAFVRVSDASILGGLHQLAACFGILVEPAAAAPWAGLRAALENGHVREEDEVVLVHTGHGLKDVASVERAASDNVPHPVLPSWESVSEIMRGMKHE